MKQLLTTALWLLLLSTPLRADENLDQSFEKDVLIIVTSKQACRKFEIYLAINAAQKRRGLMQVRHLPKMTGMLFVYDDTAIHSMWMKNTYIPLDMVFVRRDGSISNIAENTEPLSLQSIRSSEPVAYVLELNAGLTAALGIDEHSRLNWHGMQTRTE